MDKLVFEVHGLRFTLKPGRLVLLEKAGGPRTQWHLTQPLSALRTLDGRDVLRPHLTRRPARKKGRKERRAFSVDTLEPTPVKGQDWGDEVFQFTVEEGLAFLASLETMNEEILDAGHHHDVHHTDEWIRQHLIAVRERDIPHEKLVRAAYGDVEKSGRFVLNDETVGRWRETMEKYWRPAEYLDEAGPGTPDHPISVRVRCDCGAEHELHIFRGDDGGWTQRHYCSGPDEQRDAITRKYFGDRAGAAFEKVMRYLGFTDSVDSGCATKTEDALVGADRSGEQGDHEMGKKTSKPAASKASKTLSNPKSSPKQKSAAASALAQKGNSKVTGKAAASKASSAVKSGNKAAKSAAGSALSQREKKTRR